MCSLDLTAVFCFYVYFNDLFLTLSLPPPLSLLSTAQQKMKDQIEQLDERVIALENQALNTEPNSGNSLKELFMPVIRHQML